VPSFPLFFISVFSKWVALHQNCVGRLGFERVLIQAGIKRCTLIP
jgi:hypothetical protein